jgi:hypothetical protein
MLIVFCPDNHFLPVMTSRKFDGLLLNLQNKIRKQPSRSQSTTDKRHQKLNLSIILTVETVSVSFQIVTLAHFLSFLEGSQDGDFFCFLQKQTTIDAVTIKRRILMLIRLKIHCT